MQSGYNEFYHDAAIFFQQRFIGEKTLWQTFGITSRSTEKIFCTFFSSALSCAVLAAVARQPVWLFLLAQCQSVNFCSKRFAPGCMAFCATCLTRVRLERQSRNARRSFSVWNPANHNHKAVQARCHMSAAREDFRCRERNMQKETNAIIHSRLRNSCANGNR